MKKYLSVALCLCLLATLLAGCGASEPSGRYDLSSFTMEGVSYNISQLELLGLDAEVYITFSEDHSGLLCYGGEKMDFTWDSETLTSQGDSLPYRFEGGKVILSYQDTEMVFD